MSKTISLSGFEALHVKPALCEVLKRAGIVIPTPIQAGAIPIALSGVDLIGLAQTGTGKTLAFGLPMVARLKAGQTALVLAPTRELAQQIDETFNKLSLRSVLIVGGASMSHQVKALRANPQVVIATPGRLLDHLQQGTLRLNRVSIVVLDEADRMLDMGFAPAIKRILDQTPSERQTMLFSATMPKEIAELASKYLVRPQRIEIEGTGTPPELVEQELVFVATGEKPEVLAELLYENSGSVLVFSRTRHGARKLARTIRQDGHTVAEIHSNRTLPQRREALQGFKNGDYRILVATDIAARGIDVKDISLVINYDVPETPEDYVHRIGRTGRAGSEGRAITLALREQSRMVRDIEKLLGMGLRVSPRSTSRPHGSHSRATTNNSVHPRQPTIKRTEPVSKPPIERLPAKSKAEKKPPVMAFVSSRPGHRGWSGRPKRRRLR